MKMSVCEGRVPRRKYSFGEVGDCGWKIERPCDSSKRTPLHPKASKRQSQANKPASLSVISDMMVMVAGLSDSMDAALLIELHHAELDDGCDVRIVNDVALQFLRMR